MSGEVWKSRDVMFAYRAPIILSLVLCCGCDPSSFQTRRQKDYQIAVDAMRDRIKRYQRNMATDNPEPGIKSHLHFAMPGDQAAFDLLMRSGPSALSQPIVRWAAIAPNPAKSDSEKEYTHYIDIQWLETGSRVTGFFITLNNGDVHEFTNVFDPDGKFLSELAEAGPGRRELVMLSHTPDKPNELFIQWPPKLYDQLITERNGKGIGLFLQDGTKTKTGPIGYSNFDVKDPGDGTSSDE